MKKQIEIILILFTVSRCFAQVHDSSDFIFNDTIIQKYDISFYGMEKWEDTLELHKTIDESYIPGRIKWLGPNGDSITLDSVGIRYKGNSSFVYAGANPKKPYKFRFNKYKKKQLFFNMKILNFSNLVNDPSCMREKISYDFCRKFIPASRAAYAIISVNDKKIGLYLQVEEVDDEFLARNFKNNSFNLYKSSDNGALLDYKTPNQSDYSPEYDLKTNTDVNDWSRLIGMLDKLNNTPDGDFIRIVGNCLDLDNCIRYFSFNMVTSNFDSYTGSSRNFYLYDDQISKQFKLIPWDFNLGLGNYANNWDIITVDAFDTANVSRRPLALRVFSIDSLKQAYGKYIYYMINNGIGPDTFSTAAERIKLVIDSAVRNDPNSFYTYDQFLANIEDDLEIKEGPTTTTIAGIKSFPKKRFAELKKQLDREKIPVLGQKPVDRMRNASLHCVFDAAGKRICVRYSLQNRARHVTLSIRNVDGGFIRSIDCGEKSAGAHADYIPAHSLPSAFFLISLNTDEMIASTGVILTKGTLFQDNNFKARRISCSIF